MSRKTTALRILGALLLVIFAVPSPVEAHGTEVHKDQPQEKTAPSTQQHDMMTQPRMRMPSMDPVRGRKLFVSKGCVACHAINGIGGHDATPLDAHSMQPMMNPFQFAAKMWAMAPAMIAAQEEALGDQILFTGDELADIIAFVHQDKAQHFFSEADLTPAARAMMKHGHGASGGGAKKHGEEIGHHGEEGESMGHGHNEDQPKAHGHDD